jgi:hypothetical protein
MFGRVRVISTALVFSTALGLLLIGLPASAANPKITPTASCHWDTATGWVSRRIGPVEFPLNMPGISVVRKRLRR